MCWVDDLMILYFCIVKMVKVEQDKITILMYTDIFLLDKKNNY